MLNVICALGFSMPTSTATSTEMVNALYLNTASVIDASTPIIPFVLGLLFFAIGFGMLVRVFRRGLRTITR